MKISCDDIAERAFEIWEREGKPEGCERKHWFDAEEELQKEAGRGNRQKIGTTNKPRSLATSQGT